MQPSNKPTLAEIARDYRSFIRRSLTRRCVRPVDVPDLEQEVYLRAHRALPRFDPSFAATPEASLRSWLFGICKHCAGEHNRSARRRTEVPLDEEVLDTAASPEPTCEQAYERREHASYAGPLLAKLAPERRAVLLAYAVDGVPMSEIAAVSQIPLNTAWNRLRLALLDLRAATDRISVIRDVPIPPGPKRRIPR